MKGCVHSAASQHADMIGYIEHKSGEPRGLETNKSIALPPFLLLTFCIRLFDTVLSGNRSLL
jgi:hypothetical protein